MKGSYSDGGGHVVGADLGEVSAHHTVIQAVEQHDDAYVHGVLCLDSEDKHQPLVLLPLPVPLWEKTSTHH